MKKIVLSIVVYLGIITNIFSQSRINEELAVITDTKKELNGVLGWSKNEAGQWVSARNKIPEYFSLDFDPNSISEFKKIKLYIITYKAESYYLTLRKSQGLRIFPELLKHKHSGFD